MSVVDFKRKAKPPSHRYREDGSAYDPFVAAVQDAIRALDAMPQPVWPTSTPEEARVAKEHREIDDKAAKALREAVFLRTVTTWDGKAS